MNQNKNVWRLTSTELIELDEKREENGWTWSEIDWPGFGYTLERGSGEPNSKTEVKVVSTQPVHASLLVEQRELKVNKNTCEVHLICSDGYIPVHRAFLENASKLYPVPNSFINAELKESTDNEVVAISLMDVKLEHLKAVVSLMYRGEAVIDAKDQKEVKAVIDMLQITGLWDDLEVEHVDPENPLLGQEKKKTVRCHYYARNRAEGREDSAGRSVLHPKTPVRTTEGALTQPSILYPETTLSTTTTPPAERQNVSGPPTPSGSRGTQDESPENGSGGGQSRRPASTKLALPPEIRKVSPPLAIGKTPRIKRNSKSFDPNPDTWRRSHRIRIRKAKNNNNITQQSPNPCGAFTPSSARDDDNLTDGVDPSTTPVNIKEKDTEPEIITLSSDSEVEERVPSPVKQRTKKTSSTQKSEKGSVDDEEDDRRPGPSKTRPQSDNLNKRKRKKRTEANSALPVTPESSPSSPKRKRARGQASIDPLTPPNAAAEEAPPPDDDADEFNCIFCADVYSSEVELEMHLTSSCGKGLCFDLINRICKSCNFFWGELDTKGFMSHVATCAATKGQELLEIPPPSKKPKANGKKKKCDEHAELSTTPKSKPIPPALRLSSVAFAAAQKATLQSGSTIVMASTSAPSLAASSSAEHVRSGDCSPPAAVASPSTKRYLPLASSPVLALASSLYPPSPVDSERVEPKDMTFLDSELEELELTETPTTVHPVVDCLDDGELMAQMDNSEGGDGFASDRSQLQEGLPNDLAIEACSSEDVQLEQSETVGDHLPESAGERTSSIAVEPSASEVASGPGFSQSVQPSTPAPPLVAMTAEHRNRLRERINSITASFERLAALQNYSARGANAGSSPAQTGSSTQVDASQSGKEVQVVHVVTPKTPSAAAAVEIPDAENDLNCQRLEAILGGGDDDMGATNSDDAGDVRAGMTNGDGEADGRIEEQLEAEGADEASVLKGIIGNSKMLKTLYEIKTEVEDDAASPTSEPPSQMTHAPSVLPPPAIASTSNHNHPPSEGFRSDNNVNPFPVSNSRDPARRGGEMQMMQVKAEPYDTTTQCPYTGIPLFFQTAPDAASATHSQFSLRPPQPYQNLPRHPSQAVVANVVRPPSHSHQVRPDPPGYIRAGDPRLSFPVQMSAPIRSTPRPTPAPTAFHRPVVVSQDQVGEWQQMQMTPQGYFPVVVQPPVSSTLSSNGNSPYIMGHGPMSTLLFAQPFFQFQGGNEQTFTQTLGYTQSGPNPQFVHGRLPLPVASSSSLLPSTILPAGSIPNANGGGSGAIGPQSAVALYSAYPPAGNENQVSPENNANAG